MAQQSANLPPDIEVAVEAVLPEKPPTKEQIEKYLPAVLEDPMLKETISNVPLWSVVTNKLLPKENFETRCKQLRGNLPVFSDDLYPLPALKPIWSALWDVINAKVRLDQTLRQRLLTLRHKFDFYRNRDCPHWLPRLPSAEQDDPVTLFLNDESGQSEPSRLEVFEGGPPTSHNTRCSCD